MIVDSSALIALILQEPGHQKIGRALRAEDNSTCPLSHGSSWGWLLIVGCPR